MLKINEERLLNNLRSLWQIGATADGGVSRPALSEADMQGRAWFKEKVEAAGLNYQEDGAGNQSAILRAIDPSAKTVLCGSHLDTVPNGGRYDGSLGTLTAFEALQTIQEAGMKLPVHLEAISFTDEEGTVMGLMGSAAVTGRLTATDFENPRGGLKNLQAGMARARLTQESVLGAARDPATLAAFLELHIEQGSRLEESGIDVGVVTSIVGIGSAWLEFNGEAAHAGTMPMVKRKDALWGASEFAQRAKNMVLERFTPGVMNCGIIHAEPGAFNIVPAKVRLSLEFRHSTEDQIDALRTALFDLAQEVAAKNGLGLEIEHSGAHIYAAPLDERVITAIEGAADKLELSHTRLLSFAGHDTQAMSRITPSAMFFVPSVNGISHNPNELTHDRDVINGGNVVLHTLLNIVESLPWS